MLDQLITDLKQLSSGLLDEAMITRGSKWIDSLKAEFPLAHRLLMSTLYKEPKDVLAALCTMQPALREYVSNGRGWNETALAYVVALQRRLRGEDKPKSTALVNRKRIKSK